MISLHSMTAVVVMLCKGLGSIVFFRLRFRLRLRSRTSGNSCFDGLAVSLAKGRDIANTLFT